MLPKHRLVFELVSIDEWYNLIREANRLYGAHNWRCQPRVKRKLGQNWYSRKIKVWFEVPDPNFASWVAVKYSVIAVGVGNK